jgi:hypothetical protein
VPLLLVAMLAMAWGAWLGLLRIGWALPLPWPDQLLLHGPLMIGGFLGTVIGLERAIGIAKQWAYAAPLCSAAGVLVLVFGPPGPIGPVLITMASGIVVVVFVVVLTQHAALYVDTMLVGAAAWLVGNTWWVAGAGIYRVVFWWLTFVVLTIAGERLELNRVLRPTTLTRFLFLVAVGVIIAGVVLESWLPTVGARLFGIGLFTLTVWLVRYDIARRTVRQDGRTRYMAICLLAGYMWLAIAGVLLVVTAATSPGTSYDAVLHAVFVGFVISMIFGHAPIIVPAVLGRPLAFTRAFYLPLIILHVSIAIRLTGDMAEELGRLRSLGGLWNAIAIAGFVIVTTRSLVLGNPRPSHRPAA